VDDPHKKLTFENAKVQSTTHRGLQRGEKRGKFEVKRKQLKKKHVEGGEEGKSMAHVVLFPRAMPTGLLEPWPGETKK
jgi:hypothetical protein